MSSEMNVYHVFNPETGNTEFLRTNADEEAFGKHFTEFQNKTCSDPNRDSITLDSFAEYLKALDYQAEAIKETVEGLYYWWVNRNV